MIETLLIAHASFLTHPVPMAQMGLVRLEVLFLLRHCAGTLRSAADSRFSFSGSFLDEGCIRGLSSSSSETLARSGRTRGYRHHLHQVLVSELGTLISYLSV